MSRLVKAATGRRGNWLYPVFAALMIMAGGTAVQAQQAGQGKPVRMVVPQGAGGSNDILARLFAQKMGDQLGGSVVVENKAGAGGNLGHAFVAKSAPDGSTVLYNTSSLILNTTLYATPGYELRDFEAVILSATVPEVLMVHPSVPATSAAEFIAYLRANAGKVSYISSGPGNITHLLMELFLRSNNLSAVHIPYRGTGGSGLTDLVAGRAQAYFGTPLSSAPYFKDGRLRPLAVTMSKRIRSLPNVPTLAETVMPGFEAHAWQGLVVPAGTPAAIVSRYNGMLNKILADNEVRGKLEAQDVVPLGSTPAEYASYLRSEQERWGAIIRGAGVQLD